jgi:anti-sigma factor RsiW
MTERLNPHLSDETLNELLDQTLEAPARDAAAAHLATCAACAGRLDSLRAVFSGLADLPPAPLGRDLRAGVMAAVRQQQPAHLRMIADPKQPAFQAIFALQLLAALALLAFAWPFVAALAQPERLLGAGGLGTDNIAAGLASAWVSFSSLWPALQRWLSNVVSQPEVPLADVLPPVAASLVLVTAGLLWLLGNALLLRPGPGARLRRHW